MNRINQGHAGRQERPKTPDTPDGEQHTGEAAVEVRVDGGPWQQARMAAVPGIDTWRQWVWEWDATPGNHVIQARATDATGYTQTAALAAPEPNGATGYPTVNVSVQLPGQVTAADRSDFPGHAVGSVT